MTSSPAERLIAQQIMSLKRQVNALARGAGGAFRSVEGGGSTLYYDIDDNPALSIGMADDGSPIIADLSTAPPPKPSDPDCYPMPGGVSIVFDATFEDAPPPANLNYFELHAGAAPGFTADDSTQISTFDPLKGGEFFHSTDVEHYYAIVAVNNAFLESEKSDEVFAEPGDIEILPPTEPPESVTLVMEGTASSIVMKTDNIESGTEIEYHLSTTANFTPDATTLSKSTMATVYVATQMPDGTNFINNTLYYGRAIAKNVAGPAAPSDQVSTMLDPSVVNDLIAASLVAGFILTGAIQIGTILITANGDPENGVRPGIHIPQPDGSEIFFPANTTDFATITAHLIAKSLNITGNLTISGSGNLNGTLDMRSTLTRPADGPDVGYDYPRISTTLGDGSSDNAFIYNGMCADITAAHGTEQANRTVVAVAFLGGGLRFFDHRSGSLSAFPDPTSGKAWTSNFDIYGGVAADSTRGVYYVLGRDRDRSSTWTVFAIRSDTFEQVGAVDFASNAAIDNYFPKIAYYNGTVYIGWIDASNRMMLRRLTAGGNQSAVTFASAGADILVQTHGARTSLGALEIGTFDAAAAHIVYRLADSGNFIVRALAAPTVASAELGDFIAPPAITKVRGLRWVAGGTHGPRFICLDNTGRVHYFGDFKVKTTARATQAWFDPQTGATTWDASTPNAAGTTETEESIAFTEYPIPARAWLAITADPAPDEENNDGTNTNKANAVRVYAGVGTGTRYLQGTTGKSIRVVQAQVDDDYNTQLRAYVTVGLNAFTTEDIGATVTGTYIPAGTTIIDVPTNNAGQVAILSQPHTSPAGGPNTVNFTITRSRFGHRIIRSSLAAGTKTPEAVNGFALLSSPGKIQSSASGSLLGPSTRYIYEDGAGNWRLGSMYGTPGSAPNPGQTRAAAFAFSSNHTVSSNVDATPSGGVFNFDVTGPDDQFVVIYHADVATATAGTAVLNGTVILRDAADTVDVVNPLTGSASLINTIVVGALAGQRGNYSGSGIIGGLAAGSYKLRIRHRLNTTGAGTLTVTNLSRLTLARLF